MTQSQASIVDLLRRKFELLSAHLTERSVRLWAAGEAQSLGRGGVCRVAEATGLSRPTIYRGIEEAESQQQSSPIRQEGTWSRAPGGGRKSLSGTDPKLIKKLKQLLTSSTRGDPMSPLMWTSKSSRHLALELSKTGLSVSHQTVQRLLVGMGYSLQRNRKTIEGKQHADRDKQFSFIAKKSERLMARNIPVISVDTKKKEKIGRFENKGREWHKKNDPEKVKTHDFTDDELGKVSPYGVYDINKNEGWVSVGIDHDTAEFSTASIKAWWKGMGVKAYTRASEIYIVADGGGSNSSRARLWKTSLQALANDLQMTVHVSHFPPGTSKWNKIEHRMFCHITANWRNRPLSSREVVVNLIANTTTKTGLRVLSKLDKKKYKKGIAVSDEELDDVLIKRDPFHGEWNYTIRPAEV